MKHTESQSKCDFLGAETLKKNELENFKREKWLAF
jgi:hypothetical protein